jgi:lipopolysaccharide transport system ATP-binding protein
MISVEQLSKRYWIYHRPGDRLKDWCLPGGRRRAEAFWALRGVSFEVPSGTAMGIIGVNGAGKSTLLKIITGTTEPTEGRYRTQGRIASLLELGTGFHPEFTGEQNLRLGARMAGLAHDELERKYAEIVAFSELERFMDQPIRTYSSGMVLRLGFALASSVDPDVLIVDEALSVGDLHFQQKCLARIRKIHERGTTILFVSHDPGMIQKFCDEAMLLDAGQLIDRGRPDKVLDYYTARLAEKYRGQGEGEAREARVIRPGERAEAPGGQDGNLGWKPPQFVHGHRTGNFKAVITGAGLYTAGGSQPAGTVMTGATAELGVRFVALEALKEVTVGIMLRDRLGQEVFGVNTAYRGVGIEKVQRGEAREVRFALPLNLGEGLYSVTTAIHAGLNHTEICYDWVEQAVQLTILPNPGERFTGLVRLETKIAVEIKAAGDAELRYARGVRGRVSKVRERRLQAVANCVG